MKHLTNTSFLNRLYKAVRHTQFSFNNTTVLMFCFVHAKGKSNLSVYVYSVSINTWEKSQHLK